MTTRIDFDISQAHLNCAVFLAKVQNRPFGQRKKKKSNQKKKKEITVAFLDKENIGYIKYIIFIIIIFIIIFIIIYIIIFIILL